MKNDVISLDNLKVFFKEAGNFYNNIENIIHIAGTNGKGSTTAFVKSILKAHGYSVNTFTSPHLVNWNERITIKGDFINMNYVNELENILNEKYESYKNLTEFEKTAVIAFKAFIENKADFTILEVGLGGRLDATNIIESPVLSLINTIDFDHEHILGNTLALIAKEKAGIIKKEVPCISVNQIAEVKEVFKNVCAKQESALIIENEDYYLKGNTLYYKGQEITLNNLGLEGEHQYSNAALAIVAVSTVLKDKLDVYSVFEGLKNVKWPARLQNIGNSLYDISFQNNEDIILDGAHNPSGARVLKSYLKKYEEANDIYLVMGMLKTKDIKTYLEIIKDINAKVFSVDIEGHDCFSQEEISTIGSALNLSIKAKKSVKEALEEIKNLKSQKPKKIVICGSLYLIGSVMADNSLIIEY